MVQRTRRALLLVVAFLVMAPVAVDLLFETDEERIDVTLDGVMFACEARDAGAILAWCTDDVIVASGVRCLREGGALPTALRTLLSRIEELTLTRDACSFVVADEGGVRVDVRGSTWATLGSVGRTPFQVHAILRLVEDVDGAFRIAAIERFDAVPGVR
ncbi:MAG: hypothetical protein EXS13_01190 [Planctomycetes bacterium]|nr:hypothetical protein [Planctomycetota bacterium]